MIFVLLLICMVQAFIFNSAHIMALLLLLESMMLILMCYFFFILIELGSDPFMFLLMLTLGACEAALGLSVLVSLMRFHGNDQLSSVLSVKWFAKITYN
uniref:NADH-ubiquinone oxidoreductase chain 4L n=1 Tax=Deroceras reticulatum TaxID=145610 RepID=A0A343ERN0_DERRE|nr:NADH dehydrogenase subunit 4L [Deroceras reticulatum]ASL05736.1 NADH dehydrogenase subunit 4L [Deroceras reticulatum]